MVFAYYCVSARMLVTMKLMYAWFTWRGFNIPVLWEKTVQKDPGKTALIEAHTGRKFTFAEIDEFSNKTAWVLKKYDVKSGSVVAIMVMKIQFNLKMNIVTIRCQTAWNTSPVGSEQVHKKWDLSNVISAKFSKTGLHSGACEHHVRRSLSCSRAEHLRGESDHCS